MKVDKPSDEYFPGFTEKRKHRRFRLKKPIFAVLETEPVRLLDISDISQEGVALCLVADRTDLLRRAQKLAIALGICDAEIVVYLEGLLFRVAFVRALTSQKPEGITRIRCGLEFLRLTAEQREKIADLITSYRFAAHSEGVFWKVLDPTA